MKFRAYSKIYLRGGNKILVFQGKHKKLFLFCESNKTELGKPYTNFHLGFWETSGYVRVSKQEALSIAPNIDV